MSEILIRIKNKKNKNTNSLEAVLLVSNPNVYLILVTSICFFFSYLYSN